MKKLEDYKKQLAGTWSIPDQIPSGIECPKCQKELFIDNKHMLCTIPPKRTIFCLECKFVDYIPA